MCVHENLIRFYWSFEKDSHPMAILVGLVGSMAGFTKETDFAHNEK